MKPYVIGLMLRGRRTRCLTGAEYVQVSRTDEHSSHADFATNLGNAVVRHETAWFEVRGGNCRMSEDFGMLASDFSRYFGNFDATGLESLHDGRYEVLRAYVLDDNALVWSVDMPTRRVYGKSDSLNPHAFKGTLREHRRKIMMRDMTLPTRVTRVNPRRTYVVSDLHFGDPKMLRYCRKEFKSLSEMNETILERWNGVIGKSDSVFFLGDMTGDAGRRPIDYWLSMLNGRITFLRGNHDTVPAKKTTVLNRPIMVDCHGMKVMLSHYPYRPTVWDGWIIHGHVHNSEPSLYPRISRQRKTANVSAEMVNYTPVLLADLLERMIG